MFEQVLNFFLTSEEVRKFGWNISTFWVIGVNIFTIVEWWGLRKQNKKIWKERSGESLSVTLFTFLLFATWAFIFYGIAIKSASSVINGLVLGIMYMPTVTGIWKFKQWSTREKIQFWIFTSMVPAMAFFPWYNEMFLIISVGIMIATGTMLWELRKVGKTGVLDIYLLGAYLASTVFWVGYAFSIEQWVLEILAIVNVILLCITTWVWCQYYRKEKRARA